jgi:hypothetical protein
MKTHASQFLSKNLNTITLLAIWLLIGILSRVLPHFPNVTALVSLSLLAGTRFSKMQTLTLIVLTLILSDLILAYLLDYPALGSWSLFTYSGFIAIALLSSETRSNTHLRLFGWLISFSLAFWLWTNLGTWLCSGLYAHTASGLLLCYSAALPFLRNQCLGDISWMLVLLVTLKLAGMRIGSTQKKYIA